MIILDTDILSMFAKIGKTDLLRRLFSDKIAITPRIDAVLLFTLGVYMLGIL